jgi:starch synthase
LNGRSRKVYPKQLKNVTLTIDIYFGEGVVMAEHLKVLFLSPEVVPFAKTGGLADMAGSLPVALRRQGAEVRLCLPFYRMVREGNFETRSLLKNLGAPLGKETLAADVLETRMEEDIPVYLIKREDLYDRPNLYGNSSGDYYDGLERFTFFAHASLLIAEALGFGPDVIHCHDWQTGLVPALLRGPYRQSPILKDARTVFTIHNIGYQGLFPVDKFRVTGLPVQFFNPEGLEFWGKISLLKAGIVYSDAINTVSPTYAKEIQTPEFGLGMGGILHHRLSSLHGILNGVDYCLWNPAQDSYLPARYSVTDMTGKQTCKEALIRKMKLDPSRNHRPLLGMITRLDPQKGVDILMDILDRIMALDVTLVIIGSGTRPYQEALEAATSKHPGSVGLKLGLDEPLAHHIMAGADILLIPSRYEPCGLTQMYALKYGTVPVARTTGGLEDTITAFDPQTGLGNGFKFGPYEPEAFLAAVREAVELFPNKAQWGKLMANAMAADFSWDRSAHAYMELYQSLVQR